MSDKGNTPRGDEERRNQNYNDEEDGDRERSQDRRSNKDGGQKEGEKKGKDADYSIGGRFTVKDSPRMAMRQQITMYPDLPMYMRPQQFRAQPPPLQRAELIEPKEPTPPPTPRSFSSHKRRRRRGSAMSLWQHRRVAAYPPDMRPCVHLVFKSPTIPREKLSREEHIALLSRPRPAPWNPSVERDSTLYKFRVAPPSWRLSAMAAPNKRYLRGSLRESYHILSPTRIQRMVDMLQEEMLIARKGYGINVEFLDPYEDRYLKAPFKPMMAGRKDKAMALVAAAALRDDAIRSSKRLRKWAMQVGEYIGDQIVLWVQEPAFEERTGRQQALAAATLVRLRELAGPTGSLPPAAKFLELLAERLAIWMDNVLRNRADIQDMRIVQHLRRDHQWRRKRQEELGAGYDEIAIRLPDGLWWYPKERTPRDMVYPPRHRCYKENVYLKEPQFPMSGRKPPRMPQIFPKQHHCEFDDPCKQFSSEPLGIFTNLYNKTVRRPPPIHDCLGLFRHGDDDKNKGKGGRGGRGRGGKDDSGVQIVYHDSGQGDLAPPPECPAKGGSKGRGRKQTIARRSTLARKSRMSRASKMAPRPSKAQGISDTPEVGQQEKLKSPKQHATSAKAPASTRASKVSRASKASRFHTQVLKKRISKRKSEKPASRPGSVEPYMSQMALTSKGSKAGEIGPGKGLSSKSVADWENVVGDVPGQVPLPPKGRLKDSEGKGGAPPPQGAFPGAGFQGAQGPPQGYPPGPGAPQGATGYPGYPPPAGAAPPGAMGYPGYPPPAGAAPPGAMGYPGYPSPAGAAPQGAMGYPGYPPPAGAAPQGAAGYPGYPPPAGAAPQGAAGYPGYPPPAGAAPQGAAGYPGYPPPAGAAPQGAMGYPGYPATGYPGPPPPGPGFTGEGYLPTSGYQPPAGGYPGGEQYAPGVTPFTSEIPTSPGAPKSPFPGTPPYGLTPDQSHDVGPGMRPDDGAYPPMGHEPTGGQYRDRSPRKGPQSDVFTGPYQDELQGKESAHSRMGTPGGGSGFPGTDTRPTDRSATGGAPGVTAPYLATSYPGAPYFGPPGGPYPDAAYPAIYPGPLASSSEEEESETSEAEEDFMTEEESEWEEIETEKPAAEVIVVGPMRDQWREFVYHVNVLTENGILEIDRLDETHPVPMCTIREHAVKSIMDDIFPPGFYEAPCCLPDPKNLFNPPYGRLLGETMHDLDEEEKDGEKKKTDKCVSTAPCKEKTKKPKSREKSVEQPKQRDPTCGVEKVCGDFVCGRPACIADPGALLRRVCDAMASKIQQAGRNPPTELRKRLAGYLFGNLKHQIDSKPGVGPVSQDMTAMVADQIAAWLEEICVDAKMARDPRATKPSAQESKVLTDKIAEAMKEYWRKWSKENKSSKKSLTKKSVQVPENEWNNMVETVRKTVEPAT